MLRITLEEEDHCTRFRLEGKLAGDWVRELERCWIRTKNANPDKRFKIDLRAVSFVDRSGQALLEHLALEHAELWAAGNPLMTSIVNTIRAKEGATTRPLSA